METILIFSTAGSQVPKLDDEIKAYVDVKLQALEVKMTAKFEEAQDVACTKTAILVIRLAELTRVVYDSEYEKVFNWNSTIRSENGLRKFRIMKVPDGIPSHLPPLETPEAIRNLSDEQVLEYLKVFNLTSTFDLSNSADQADDAHTDGE